MVSASHFPNVAHVLLEEPMVRKVSSPINATFDFDTFGDVAPKLRPVIVTTSPTFAAAGLIFSITGAR
jgi:hypothetical protein